MYDVVSLIKGACYGAADDHRTLSWPGSPSSGGKSAVINRELLLLVRESDRKSIETIEADK